MCSLSPYIAFEELKPLLGDAFDALYFFVNQIRSHYQMDESWDPHKCKLKFRYKSRTLTDLRLLQGSFSALVVYGKAEREKFELARDQFPADLLNYYDACTIYRDGKWMFFDIKTIEQAKDILKMLRIKRKYNRIMDDANPTEPTAPVHCDNCYLYHLSEHNDEKLLDFQQMAEHCYGDIIVQRLESDQCPGYSANGCPIQNLLKTNTLAAEGFPVALASCRVGVTAEEITKLVIPYC